MPPLVIAHHMIWTAYGWWLANDPRGSGSFTVRTDVLAELGDLHHGRKRVQPTSTIIRDFQSDAEDLLRHPRWTFDLATRQQIALAFADIIAEMKYTCYACAIMPDHIHLLIRKHKCEAEEMIAHLKDRSRQYLIDAGISSQPHPIWSGGLGWKVFLDHPDEVRRTIRYIERNPVPIGEEQQVWPFVTPYNGWPLHPGHSPSSPLRQGAEGGGTIPLTGRASAKPQAAGERMSNILQTADPEIWQTIADEARRQQDGLEMIASENYTSPAVMAAQGSILTNKYAEGLPGKRYYGGCEFVDVAERLAIDRLLKLFGAERANVQPHSGAQANMAVYFAALNHGDTILAMDLAHGGHLTHGMHLNFSGKWYKIVGYGVRQSDERIDYDQVARLAREHKPKMIVAGASAYPREIDFARFKEIGAEVGALFMVDMAHIAGLVAAGKHVSPVPYADFVTTTTHKTLRGPRGGVVLCRADWEKKINSAVFPGLQGGPLMHVIAAKAVSFAEALRPEFKTYAAQTIVNAQTLAQELQRRGFRIVSGGTDNHLLLVDVASRGLGGKVAEETLDHAGITVNKNKIPFDPRPPLDPSGIRIGTPALTTRGMKEAEMRQIAGWIDQALAQASDRAALERIHGEVRELCKQFPAPA